MPMPIRADAVRLLDLDWFEPRANGSILASVGRGSTVPPLLWRASWPLVRWLRWKPVAMRWLNVGFGSRSPASCSIARRSNGMSALNASMTHSRHFQAMRAVSRWQPGESAGA